MFDLSSPSPPSAAVAAPSSFHFRLIIILLISRGISGATFTFINRCEFTVWPGILANGGSAPLESTGFELASGGSRSLHTPSSWSGRFWGRTDCSFDPITGQGTCLSGDCGSDQVQCNGAGAQPPATLAEFTVGSGSASGSQDFYDVSLVDGYNLPMVVEASGGSGACLSTGCGQDLNRFCPAELRFASGAGCRSACEAFQSDEYCCRGAFGSPATCKPSMYSTMFKAACPKSYSYAYDDATSTFTCTAADYMITFCPLLPGSKKSAATDDSHRTFSWLPDFDIGDAPKPLSHHASMLLCFFISPILFIFFLKH